VEFDSAQLSALDAAVTHGTLEAAARALRVTPSAVSQRLKALEVAAGRVLLVRSKPVRVTPSGEVVLRLARQLRALTADTRRELGAGDDGGPAARTVLPLAVNADSLATWVLPALVPVAATLGLDLHREDQDRTGELLREGRVMAAITSRSDPIPGCRSVRLGAMRYRPTASVRFAAQWFPGGVTRPLLEAAPMIVFDRDDDLQHRYLRAVAARTGRPVPDPPVHRIPSSVDFLTAVRLGLGWGMLPDLQSARCEPGELLDVDPAGAIDVVLHWQQWKMRSPSLDRVAEAVIEAARAALR
jgi:LysR family transcriptional regulator, chromosome initiation inhibitor